MLSFCRKSPQKYRFFRGTHPLMFEGSWKNRQKGATVDFDYLTTLCLLGMVDGTCRIFLGLWRLKYGWKDPLYPLMWIFGNQAYELYLWIRQGNSETGKQRKKWMSRVVSRSISTEELRAKPTRHSMYPAFLKILYCFEGLAIVQY